MNPHHIFLALNLPAAEGAAAVGRVLGLQFEEDRFGERDQDVTWYAKEQTEDAHLLFRWNVFRDDDDEKFPVSPYAYFLQVEIRHHEDAPERARRIYERLKALGVPMMLDFDLWDVLDTFAPAA